MSSRMPGEHGRSRFTLVELIIVIVLVAGIVLFIVFPFNRTSPEKARRVNCAAKLKHIGLGLLLYSSENDGFFIVTPNGSNFEPLNTMGLLQVKGDTYSCPSSKNSLMTAAKSGYNYEGSGIKDDAVLPTSTTEAPEYPRIAFDQSGNHPDNKWMNALFVDGHVEGWKPDGSKTWNTYK